jgi:hypothetical protein
VISNNATYGINLNGANSNTIEGNIIGADVTGTVAMGNTLDGVHLTTAVGNIIGGTAARTANIIAFNGAGGTGGNAAEGIHISDSMSVNNSFLRNSIFSNVQLGIELGNGLVTTNDPCNVNPGPNNLQNYPVLTTATSNGASTTVHGMLNSTASTTFRIEFFSNAMCDPSGFGEGQTFLGAASVTTNSSCNVTFLVTLPAASTTTVTSSLNPSTQGTAVTFTATVRSASTGTVGKRITATATDPHGNTSEFSACVLSTQTATVTPAGSVTFKDGTTVLGTKTLSGGSATLTTSTLAVGRHSITAVYGGNADFTGSTSPALIQTVN